MNFAFRLLCLVTCLGFALANGQGPTNDVEAIRQKALTAWNANEEHSREVLYSKETWAEFYGPSVLNSGVLAGSALPEKQTPVLREHFETINGSARYVIDGWSDQPPLDRGSNNIDRRMDYGSMLLDRGEMVREFLGPNRQFAIVDMKSERGYTAYVLESKRRGPVRRTRGSPSANCASGMDATLYLDSVTYFPIRVEALVLQANSCPQEEPGGAFNRPGARALFHQVKVTGSDPCGQRHSVFTADQGVLVGNAGQVDGMKMYSGTVAERVFRLSPESRGGFQKVVSVTSGFRLFVSCAVLKTESASAVPADDRVEVESYFAIKGVAAEGGIAPSSVLVDPAVPASAAVWASRQYTVSTIAGIGASGTNRTWSDGEPSVYADLRPHGVAMDAAGNLYVASENSVRKITPRGLMFLIAGSSSSDIFSGGGLGEGTFSGDGGLAIRAGINYASGVAIDAAGNLYIADTGNHRIRKVDSKGVITTVAGTGVQGFSGDGGLAINARLSNPSGVAADAGGNIYVADMSNSRIRRISPSGIISTVVTSVTSFGLATDAAGNLYIPDRRGRVLKRTASGAITTIVGSPDFQNYSMIKRDFCNDDEGGPATRARLDSPDGVAVDPAGNLYIADSGSCVRKVATDGTIRTIARLVAPRGLAIGRDGEIYVSDAPLGPGGWIRVLTPVGTKADPASSSKSTALVNPDSPEKPRQGTSMTPTQGPVRSGADEFKQLPSSATEVAVGADGSAFMIGTSPCGNQGCGIYKFDGSNWQPIRGQGVRVAVDPQGDPWVIDRQARIFRTVNGRFVQLAGAATDIGIGADGSVFAVGTAPCNEFGCGIYKFDGSNWQPIAERDGRGVRIAVDPLGNPWVVNRKGGIFRMISGNFVQVPGAATEIGVGSDGSVFIVGSNPLTESGYGLYKFSGNGFSEVPGLAVGVSVDPLGNPWIVDRKQGIYRHVR